jgi:flagellar hook-associated protein 2
MGTIQTSIGLMSGIPIVDTVDKLIAVARRPRDLLAAQNKTFQQQQTAITELAALVATVQFAARNLGKSELFGRRTAESAQPQVIDVAVTGSPPLGTVSARPLRLASNHQLISSGIAAANTPLGGGAITWRFGPHLSSPVTLSVLNGGAGFIPGQIRITDRSGSSVVIDLSAAQTIGDVLELINTNPLIRVQASSEGDRIRLTDLSGGTGRLVVQEVTPGTAASLGLAQVNTDQPSAVGEDILRLAPEMPLSLLNDGLGIRSLRFLPEIRYQLRDGSTGTINLAPVLGNNRSLGTISLGEVLNHLNRLAPNKFQVEISADGDRLIFRDLTEGEGQTALQALHDSRLLQDLGLTGSAQDGVIVGRRLLGGLQTVLLSRLNGGAGLGTLGTIRIVDRSGQEALVNLAGAETVEEIISRINQAGISVRATLNSSSTGIVLRDFSGQDLTPLTVASADDTGTAEKLHLAVQARTDSVDSGDLHLQIISVNTPLSALNGGRGVGTGSFTIFDSRGNRRTITVSPQSIATVGDLIGAINGAGLSVRAELNPTGDGIRLVDYGNGTGQLRVVARSGTTAADLQLLRPSQTEEVGDQTVQVIDGSFTFQITLGTNDTLENLVARINAAGGGLRASLVNDGTSRPWRLVLQSEQPGWAGALVVSSSGLPLSFSELAPAQDALLSIGAGSRSGRAVVLSSTNNVFDGVLPGLRVTAKQVASESIPITVRGSEADVVASAKVFVDNYNRLREKLAEHTKFDPATGSKGPLFGDIVAYRLQTELPRLLSSAVASGGRFTSLRQLGIELKDDGSLSLNESALREAFAADAQAVGQFFADATTGFGKKLDQLLEQLGGGEKSLLVQRMEALSRKIEWNTRRIEQMDAQLDRQRQRLLRDFYRLDRIVGQMQTQLSVVERLNSLALQNSRSNR